MHNLLSNIQANQTSIRQSHTIQFTTSYIHVSNAVIGYCSLLPLKFLHTLQTFEQKYALRIRNFDREERSPNADWQLTGDITEASMVLLPFFFANSNRHEGKPILYYVLQLLTLFRFVRSFWFPDGRRGCRFSHFSYFFFAVRIFSVSFLRASLLNCISNGTNSMCYSVTSTFY